MGNEKLIWVVILGRWVSYVIEEKIYVVEPIYEMNVSIGSVLVWFMMIRSVYNHALRILGYWIGEQQY